MTPQAANRSALENPKESGCDDNADSADMLATLDTDKDGANDLDELRAGTDPGSANNTLICMPNYGCFASRIARSTGRTGSADGAGAALALAVAAVCVLAGRRRGRAG